MTGESPRQLEALKVIEECSRLEAKLGVEMQQRLR